MDIVNVHTDDKNGCTPPQVIHVYQHVNFENLESSAPTALQAAFLNGTSEVKCPPQDTATHEEQSALTCNLGKNEVL